MGSFNTGGGGGGGGHSTLQYCEVHYVNKLGGNLKLGDIVEAAANLNPLWLEGMLKKITNSSYRYHTSLNLD